MKLQKSSLFALYAVLELASDPQRQLSTAEIAEKYRISSHHLSKVMRQLVRSGLVGSERGASGGYRFVGNVSRTTLLDVICLFEPQPSQGDHPAASAAEMPPIVAALQAMSEEIEELTEATLDSVTLKSLLHNARRAIRARRRGASA